MSTVQETLDTLMAMGFPEAKAKTALNKTGNFLSSSVLFFSFDLISLSSVNYKKKDGRVLSKPWIGSWHTKTTMRMATKIKSRKVSSINWIIGI